MPRCRSQREAFYERRQSDCKVCCICFRVYLCLQFYSLQPQVLLVCYAELQKQKRQNLISVWLVSLYHTVEIVYKGYKIYGLVEIYVKQYFWLWFRIKLFSAHHAAAFPSWFEVVWFFSAPMTSKWENCYQVTIFLQHWPSWRKEKKIRFSILKIYFYFFNCFIWTVQFFM